MKQEWKWYPPAAAVLGIAGLALRLAYYAAAYDPASALLGDSPLAPALWVITALALGLALLAGMRARRFDYRPQGPSVWALAGCLAMAAGIGWSAAHQGPAMVGFLGTAWQVLALLAPICLTAVGLFRLWGRKPPFALHLPVCLFWLAHLVNQYQGWSGTPQLSAYVYALLGCMGLMLCAYYIAARAAGDVCLGMHLGVGLAAVPMCLIALARTDYPWLYLSGAVWVLLDLPRRGELRPSPKKETP